MPIIKHLRTGQSFKLSSDYFVSDEYGKCRCCEYTPLVLFTLNFSIDGVDFLVCDECCDAYELIPDDEASINGEAVRRDMAWDFGQGISYR